jgi:hypothetical protein
MLAPLEFSPIDPDAMLDGGEPGCDGGSGAFDADTLRDSFAPMLSAPTNALRR